MFTEQRDSGDPIPLEDEVIALDELPADIRIYQVALEKDYTISTLLRQFETMAVDCPLEYARNKFPDIYDNTEICYYQQCKYQCSSKVELPNEKELSSWLKNSNPNLDESTFLSYFLDEEIERIEKYFDVLFHEMVQEGEYFTGVIELYYRMQNRFPELNHQIIGFKYFLMALAELTRRQYRLYIGGGQAFYLKFIGDTVYFTLNRDSTNVADITTAMFRDLTIHTPVMEKVVPLIESCHQRIIPKLVNEYVRSQKYNQGDKFIYRLPAELKSSLYEYVYDKSDETSRTIKEKFEQLLPDRFMTLPYLVRSMIDYQKILSREVKHPGRPAASGQQSFTPNILEKVNAETERVYVHMLNFVMTSKYNIIANVINVQSAKFRLYRNGKWETPHAPEYSTPMDIVYRTYVALQRIEMQKDTMRRALDTTGGIYGYRIRHGTITNFHIAEITEDEFVAINQKNRSGLTGANRDVKKGRLYVPNRYNITSIINVQKAYNTFARRNGLQPNEKQPSAAANDVPQMLDKMGLTLNFSYDTN